MLVVMMPIVLRISQATYLSITKTDSATWDIGSRLAIREFALLKFSDIGGCGAGDIWGIIFDFFSFVRARGLLVGSGVRDRCVCFVLHVYRRIM